MAYFGKSKSKNGPQKSAAGTAMARKRGLKINFPPQNKKVRDSGSTENKIPMAPVEVFKKVRVPSLIFLVFLFKDLGVANKFEPV